MSSQAVDTNDSDNYGSIYLVTTSPVIAHVKERVPVEAMVDDADGVAVNILLHVKDGQLNELEVIKTDGSKMVAPIRTETMHLIVREK